MLLRQPLLHPGGSRSIRQHAANEHTQPHFAQTCMGANSSRGTHIKARDAVCSRHVACLRLSVASGLWFYGYNELATMTIKKTSAVTQVPWPPPTLHTT